MKFSQMSNAVTPSLTRQLFNMAYEIGGDVIDLTLGDPDILPPLEIRQAACDAIAAGKTRYSANAGLALLREKYASFFEKHYGLKINGNKNVIATVGGMEALFLSLASIVDPGDEVIVLAPYYVNYVQMIGMMNGVPIIVDRLNKNDLELIGAIERCVSKKTVAMIVNSPCNPTGDIIAPDLLDAVTEIASKNDLIVISDEVYNSLVFDGFTAESIVTRNGMQDRTVVIDSCSKRFAMTGYRIGFAAGPEEIIKNMTKMQENVAACAPLPSQYAAIKALSEDFDYSYINDTYQHRRDLVYNALRRIPKLQCIKPKATFYCFVDISKTGYNSREFAFALLEKKHVAVVPGVTYGETYDNYVRIAFTLDDEKLNNAMKRIEEFCGE